MMSKFINCIGQPTDDIGISVGCLIIAILPNFLSLRKEIKNIRVFFARKGNVFLSKRQGLTYFNSATDRKGYAFCFSIEWLNTRRSRPNLGGGGQRHLLKLYTAE